MSIYLNNLKLETIDYNKNISPARRLPSTSKKLKIGWNRLTHRPRAVRICVIARDFFIHDTSFSHIFL